MSIVYAFGGSPDGANPYYGGLIDVKGTLYGTTEKGGTDGGGTVFSVNPKTGAETVVYSFMGGSDGEFPFAGVIDVKGMLYGTTYNGGTAGVGTVFSVNPKTGAETVLHSFGSGTDGKTPYAGLIDVNGTLYGTTYGGGTAGEGTVFSVNPKTGAESVLHSFGSGSDGAQPYAAMIDVKNTLYGTTEAGGAHFEGTVFAIDLKTGAETVVYNFCSQQGCADGAYPAAGLIDVQGTLYGTTGFGGTSDVGTAFALDPKTGAEKVLHSFGSIPDGEYPDAGLIDVNGALYGTTNAGGTNNLGTVFSVSAKSGAEKVAYAFCSQQACADGRNPYAGLIDIKGTLYGTTYQGGTGCAGDGCGTLFALGKP